MEIEDENTIPIDKTRFDNSNDQYEPIEYAEREKLFNQWTKISFTSVNWTGDENSKSHPDHWHWISWDSITGVKIAKMLWKSFNFLCANKSLTWFPKLVVLLNTPEGDSADAEFRHEEVAEDAHSMPEENDWVGKRNHSSTAMQRSGSNARNG